MSVNTLCPAVKDTAEAKNNNNSDTLIIWHSLKYCHEIFVEKSCVAGGVISVTRAAVTEQ